MAAIETGVQYLKGTLSFFKAAFSDNGAPSSSRIIGGWLCISSMALIWYIVRHAMWLPAEKMMIWVGGLPAIVAALAGFTVAPYGINTIGSMFGKKDKEN